MAYNAHDSQSLQDKSPSRMLSFMNQAVYQPRMVASSIRGVQDFRACSEMYHTETRAQLWDMGVPGKQDELLDDDGLRKKLAQLGPFWAVDGKSAEEESHVPKFVLITVLGEPSKQLRAIHIRADTLESVMEVAGIRQQSTQNFFSTGIPNMYYCLQYDDDADDSKPTSIVVFLRCPKQSNAVMGAIRVQFSTRHCFAFLNCCRLADIQDIQSRCMANMELLQIHPLYLLSFIYDQRFFRWSDWVAQLWKEVSELETVNNMTHPQWRISQMDAQRLQFLSNTDTLLTQLHATNLRLCHSHTVMSFGRRFGKFCSDTLVEMEERRSNLGFNPLSKRDSSGLEEAFNFTLVRCESMSDRLTELSNRLAGQINVSYNIIAQKDSKINLAIAKLQVQDSQTVKGIAVLTYLFLPATLVATLWTTNLFEIKGEKNWQIYLATSLVSTVLAFLCWWSYGRFTRSRGEARWQIHASLESTNLSPPSVHDFLE